MSTRSPIKPSMGGARPPPFRFQSFHGSRLSQFAFSKSKCRELVRIECKRDTPKRAMPHSPRGNNRAEDVCGPAGKWTDSTSGDMTVTTLPMAFVCGLVTASGPTRVRQLLPAVVQYLGLRGADVASVAERNLDRLQLLGTNINVTPECLSGRGTAIGNRFRTKQTDWFPSEFHFLQLLELFVIVFRDEEKQAFSSADESQSSPAGLGQGNFGSRLPAGFVADRPIEIIGSNCKWTDYQRAEGDRGRSVHRENRSGILPLAPPPIAWQMRHPSPPLPLVWRLTLEHWYRLPFGQLSHRRTTAVQPASHRTQVPFSSSRSSVARSYC